MGWIRATASAGVVCVFAVFPVAAWACHAVRLSVEVARQQPQRGATNLDLRIKLRDEGDRPCEADRDYPIRVEALSSKRDPSGQPVVVAGRDSFIPRGQTDPPDRDLHLSVPQGGVITIRVSGNGLRPGITGVWIRGSAAPEPYRMLPYRAPAVRLIPAAYRPGEEPPDDQAPPGFMEIVVLCSGGVLSANGIQSATVTAQLKSPEVAPEPITLMFPKGGLDWNGIVGVQKGASSGGVEVQSKHTGKLVLSPLLSSTPPTVHLSNEGDVGCGEVEFISPKYYADVELESGRIAFGQPVRISVAFLDLGHNPVPIDDAGEAFLKIQSGPDGSFTSPVLEPSGRASIIFKPGAWGTSSMVVPSLRTVTAVGDGTWREGPAALEVTFPFAALWICLLFGSAGGALAASFIRGQFKQWLPARLAFGVGAAVLLVSSAIGVSLRNADWQQNTFLLVALALGGGCCGPKAFDWFAGTIGIAPPLGDSPAPAPPAGEAKPAR